MKTPRFATQLISVLGTVLMTLGWLALSHSPASSASSPVSDHRLKLLQTELGFRLLAELMGDTEPK